MTNKKILDEQSLAEIGEVLTTQLESAVKSWDVGMRYLKLNSSEYKRICAAGKKTQAAYDKMRLIACDMCGDEFANKHFPHECLNAFN